jgi:hypothetical protein
MVTRVRWSVLTSGETAGVAYPYHLLELYQDVLKVELGLYLVFLVLLLEVPTTKFRQMNQWAKKKKSSKLSYGPFAKTWFLIGSLSQVSNFIKPFAVVLKACFTQKRKTEHVRPRKRAWQPGPFKRVEWKEGMVEEVRVLRVVEELSF